MIHTKRIWKQSKHDISIKSITSFIHLKSERKNYKWQDLPRNSNKMLKCFESFWCHAHWSFFPSFFFSFVALIPGRRLLLVVPLVLFQLTLKNYHSRTLDFCMDSAWAVIMPPKIRLGNIKAKPFQTDSFGLSASSFPSLIH